MPLQQITPVDLHYNVILLGKTGAGKSASGNTILGQKVFISKKCFRSVSQVVQKERVTLDGVTLDVFDTPGLFDPRTSNEDIMEKWQPLLQLDTSVPTVFLLVMKADRFTPEEKNTVELIEEFLSDSFLQNTWILFTRGDELEREELTIEEFIEDTEELKRVIQKFNNRYHVFNNIQTQNTDQVTRLIEKIKEKPPCMVPDVTLPRITPPGPEKDPHHRRIILVGKTGAGKSSTGNTILKEKRFRSELSMSSITTQCEVGQAVVAGRNVSVVDTPGIFDTHKSPEMLAVEIGMAVYLSSPGAHAFLYVLPINDRFTEQEEQVIQKLELMFGEEMIKYTILLFTRGDQLKGKSVEMVIKESKILSKLAEQCGGYHIFNNEDQRNRDQINELLEKIDRVVEKNGGSCYSNKLFEDAARLRKEEEKRRKREEEEINQREEQQRKEEKENIRRETEEEIRKEMAMYMAQMSGYQTKNGSNAPTSALGSTRPPQNQNFSQKIHEFIRKYKSVLLVAGCVGTGILLGGVLGAVIGSVICCCTASSIGMGALIGVATGASTGLVVGAGVGSYIDKGTGAGAATVANTPADRASVFNLISSVKESQSTESAAGSAAHDLDSSGASSQSEKKTAKSFSPKGNISDKTPLLRYQEN